jgi:hypothetical protein
MAWRTAPEVGFAPTLALFPGVSRAPVAGMNSARSSTAPGSHSPLAVPVVARRKRPTPNTHDVAIAGPAADCLVSQLPSRTIVSGTEAVTRALKDQAPA